MAREDSILKVVTTIISTKITTQKREATIITKKITTLKRGAKVTTTKRRKTAVESLPLLLMLNQVLLLMKYQHLLLMRNQLLHLMLSQIVAMLYQGSSTDKNTKIITMTESLFVAYEI